MKYDGIDVTPAENDFFIVKGSRTYVKLGKKELKYLFEIKQIETKEIDFTEADELSVEGKELLKGKFKEWGFLDEEGTFQQPKRNDISMIHLVNLNPEHFLNKVSPLFGMLYTKQFLFLYFILNCVLAMFMFKNSSEVLVQLEGLQMSFVKVVIVFIAILFTTMLHEIGHAVVCRKYGGKVSEVGLCLFFLMPCLFCNVSDIYLFQKKREKAFVSLAGVYINSLFSDIALLVYFIVGKQNVFTDCLFLYYVSNVGIIFFNLIPLVKLDGYWFLTAILGVNNLLVKSTILALVGVFDRSLMKKVAMPCIKKWFIMFYGWIVLGFRPFFWYWSIVEVSSLMDKTSINFVKIIVIGVVAALALGDTLKFYVKCVKNYKNERVQILSLI